MPTGTDSAELSAAFAQVRDELDVRQEFPAEVLAETRRAATGPEMPARDLTDVEFLTIDPPGSMDLDQAMYLSRVEGDGDHPEAAFRVRYAIADVPAFVTPGGALDEEVRLRGQTIYCPDTRVPLHPPELSEDAASLLPEAVRPAYVWDILLDARGRRVWAGVARARVRSRRRWTYVEAQEQIDAGTAEDTLLLLREVGLLLVRQESARGGASLPMPEQEVLAEDGRYRLRLRPLLEAEDWNAQISLLTGMAAADLMVQGRVGILRTMPPAEDSAVQKFRRQVAALGVDWPQDLPYGDFLRTLDRADPAHLAIIHDATSLFRGAGYTPFDGTVPEESVQAAIGAPYAHVTAPLRRLVDRYALVVCAALSAGEDVPGWARTALPGLAGVMARSGQQAGAVDRACVDAVEAAVLRDRVGEVFPAVVVDRTGGGDLLVQVTEPAITASADGAAELGQAVRVELTVADVGARTVRFRVVGPA